MCFTANCLRWEGMSFLCLSLAQRLIWRNRNFYPRVGLCLVQMNKEREVWRWGSGKVFCTVGYLYSSGVAQTFIRQINPNVGGLNACAIWAQSIKPLCSLKVLRWVSENCSHFLYHTPSLCSWIDGQAKNLWRALPQSESFWSSEKSTEIYICTWRWPW